MGVEEKLKKIDRVIKEYAPEVRDVWCVRKDISEDQGIRTGRLHENHILGIIIKHDIESTGDVTTTDIEEEYGSFFKKIARSTVSTYLNQLEKEGVLYKKRDGRTVKYFFQIPPPRNIEPFWICRNFCLLPPYFSRAGYFADLYLDEKRVIEKYEKERKFILGLIILVILKNRFEKCYLCQFGNKQFYKEQTDLFESYIKERIDVLPDELRDFILKHLGELPIFGGQPINESNIDELYEIIKDYISRFHDDIEFQINVSIHRQEIHLKRMNMEKEKNGSDRGNSM